MAFNREKLPPVIGITFYTVFFGFIYFLILRLNGGHFVYSLDDPYIHLALADHINSGHYGINSGEYSAPSSSIIWPFLLALFAKFPYFNLIPLLFNYLSSVVTILLFATFFKKILPPVTNVWIHGGFLVFLIMATNLIGLTFTGMEHSLQVLLSVLLILGLIEEKETKRIPWWLMLALVAGPLIRYENLALTVPALAYLLIWRRHYVVTVSLGAVVLLCLVSFAIWLHTKNLGFFPSSVLAKSDAVSEGGLRSVLVNVLENLKNRQGTVLLLIGILLLGRTLFERLNGVEDRFIAIIMIIAIGLHMMLGRFGWFDRYEIYMLSAALIALLYVYRDRIFQTVKNNTHNPLRLLIFLSVTLVAIAPSYLRTMFLTPLASNNIYEQQYQMHRFAQKFYRGPVAVNDIGYVAYQNEYYVLDLWGLGSLEALEGRKTPGNTAWMSVLTEKYDIGLAMIYESWYPNIPSSWVKVANLRLGKTRVSANNAVVTFFVLDPNRSNLVHESLLAFKASLPAGVVLEILR